jgi:hypothetical protein
MMITLDWPAGRSDHLPLAGSVVTGLRSQLVIEEKLANSSYFHQLYSAWLTEWSHRNLAVRWTAVVNCRPLTDSRSECPAGERSKESPDRNRVQSWA